MSNGKGLGSFKSFKSAMAHYTNYVIKVSRGVWSYDFIKIYWGRSLS